MKIATQPCSNKDAQQHYIDTVQNPVDLNSIKRFLAEKDYDELSKLYPDGNLIIWGVTPSNESKWNKISEGTSVSLFYKDKMFFSQALITKKIHNKALSLHLWGTDHKSNTWEFIYFLDKLLPLALDVKAFNHAVGYSEGNIVQGFNVLDGDKAENLYSSIEEFEVLDTDIGYSQNEYEEVIDKEFKGELDSQSKGVVRKEQGYLRSKLFRGKSTYQCAICHEEFPVQMLVAGHIKKRSKCSREEKLDANNIVMPVCKFGCDELFENGFIRVDENGNLYSTNSSKVTPYVKAHIDSLVNTVCLSHNEYTEPYFKWHREFHESGKIKKD